MDAELETKLRELIDRSEIWQVMQRYARGLDRMDNELARSCYWDDATEDHNHYVGDPDGFIKYADQSTLLFETCMHGLLNHTCELAGDDAWCETYFMFSGECAEPPHFMSTGRYVDHFQRRGGEWRIANRVTIVDGLYAMDQSKLVDPHPAWEPGTKPSSRDRNDVSYHRPLVPRPHRPHE